MSIFTPQYGVTTTLTTKVVKRTITVKLTPADIIDLALKHYQNSLLKDAKNLKLKDAVFHDEEDGALIFRCEAYSPEE